LRVGNPIGARLYYGEYLNWSLSLQGRFKGALNYVRFSRHAAVSWPRIVRESARPLLTACCLLPGLVLFLTDRLRLNLIETRL
jgi:hypothetical protein